MLQNNVFRYIRINVLHLYLEQPNLLQMTAFGALEILHDTFDSCPLSIFEYNFYRNLEKCCSFLN